MAVNAVTFCLIGVQVIFAIRQRGDGQSVLLDEVPDLFGIMSGEMGDVHVSGLMYMPAVGGPRRDLQRFVPGARCPGSGLVKR
jgi:hypothetical protein